MTQCSPKFLWPVCSAPVTIFKGNDILALYIEFTKEVCTYKLCGGSSVTPLQDCERECYLLRNYLVGIRKKKKPKQNKLMVMTEQAFLSLEARARLCACSRVAQSCTTPCKPTDFSPPGSAVPGILQETVLEWVAISFSRGSSTPRDQTLVSCIPGRFFTHWASWEALLLLGRAP